MPLEKVSRRSSILKPSKARNPLGELEQLRPSEEDGPTEVTRNRRVSFSHKKGVALFTSEEGNTIWHNIYEEQNKPDDLSDLGGGSNLHISIDNEQPEIKQESIKKPDPTFQTHDDEDEHCVNIQALLSAINSPSEKQVSMKLVLEMTQPSISDKTDILINYKIPNDDGSSLTNPEGKTVIKTELEILEDKLFDESQAEMSITQDIPVKILTNEVNKKVNMENDEAKWNDNKENVTMRGCLEYIDEHGDDIKEEIDIKDESVHISDIYCPGTKRRPSETCEDYPEKKIKCELVDPNKMSLTNVLDNNSVEASEQCEMSMSYCFTKEIKMNKKRETIGYNIKATDMTIPDVDSENIDPFADLKSVRLLIKNNEPSGVHMNNSVKDAANVENINNFEFIQCDNVENSFQTDILDVSDVLKEKQDDSFNADFVVGKHLKCNDNNKPYTSENIDNCMMFGNADVNKEITKVQRDHKCTTDINKSKCVNAHKENETIRNKHLFNDDSIDCNMSMTDIVSAMKQHLDCGQFGINKSNLEDDSSKHDQNKIDQKDVEKVHGSEKITNKGKTICIATDLSNCNMFTTNALPLLKEKLGNEKTNIVFNHNKSLSNISMTVAVSNKDLDSSALDLNIDDLYMDGVINKNHYGNRNTGNDYLGANVSMTKVIFNNEIVTNCDDNRETIVFDNVDLKPNMSMTTAILKDSSGKTTLFDNDAPDADMSMTAAIPNKKNNATRGTNRRTIVFDNDAPDADMSMTTSVLKDSSGKTTLFDNDAPDADMSMTTAVSNKESIAIRGTNRRTIVFDNDAPDADMSMTTAVSNKKSIATRGTNRRTIVFDNDAPDADMSMTTAVSNKKSIATRGTNRRTIVFDNDAPDADMSMTTAVSNKKSIATRGTNRRTIVFDNDAPDADMSMTTAVSNKKSIATRGTNRRTIVFDNDAPDADMSMTTAVSNKESIAIRGTNRRTIVFDNDAPDADMSMTTAVSNKESIAIRGTNRRTIVFDNDAPDADMSMTTAVSNKESIAIRGTNRRTIVFDNDAPDADMSMTTAVSNKESIAIRGTNRRTIVFDNDAPDADMSMTTAVSNKESIATRGTNRRTIVFDNDAPDADMSMTTAVSNKESIATKSANRRTIVYAATTTSEDIEIKRRSSIFDIDVEQSFCGVTNKIISTEFPCNFNESLSDVSMAEENYLHKNDSVHDENISERKSRIIFTSMLKCDVSITGIYPIDDMNETVPIKSVKDTIFGNEYPAINSRPPGFGLHNDIHVVDIGNIKSTSANEQSKRLNILDSNVINAEQNVEIRKVNNSVIVETVAFQKAVASTSSKAISSYDHEKKTYSKATSHVLQSGQREVNKVNQNHSKSVYSESDHGMNYVPIGQSLSIIQQKDGINNCVNNKLSALLSQTGETGVGRLHTLPKLDECVDSYSVQMQTNKNSNEESLSLDHEVRERVFGFVDEALDKSKKANRADVTGDEKCLGKVCKDNTLTVIDNSCLSTSAIVPRITPNTNYNLTMNSVSSFIPNLSETKSILLDHNLPDNKIVDISKCFGGYRDPHKSGDDSLFAGEKSALSLPLVDDSGLEDFFLNQTVSKPTSLEDKLNTTSSGFISPTNDVDEMSVIHQETIVFDEVLMLQKMASQVLETDTCTIKKSSESNVDITLPKMYEDGISESLQKVHDNRPLTNKNNEVFHMSIDEYNISSNTSVNNLGEQAPVSHASEFLCITKESHVDLNSGIGTLCQTILNKSNVTNTEQNIIGESKVNVDDNVEKLSVKRKSDSDSNMSSVSLSMSLSKKQKIVVPEVCSWLKDTICVSNAKQDKNRIWESEIAGTEVDSYTYTISRGQLEHLAKIKELNDDINEQLNGSDHFIENINMSLIDSSLDKSSECLACGGNEEKQSVVEDSSGRKKVVKMSLCESVRSSTETEDSPCKVPDKETDILQALPVAEPRKIMLKKTIENFISDLDDCDVTFEPRELVFTLMRKYIRLRISFEADITERSDNLSSVSDILLEQKIASSSNMLFNLQNTAAKLALTEMDVKCLKSTCLVGGDIPKMLSKCYHISKKAWNWGKQCYSFFVKYNLRLVDDQRWSFEICDGYHLSAWDIEIGLHNKKVLHYTKPENVRIKVAFGKAHISESLLKDVVEKVEHGWNFIPDLISELHKVIKSSRKNFEFVLK